jgi:hypothetical protein
MNPKRVQDDDDDTASIYRSMRYKRQDINHYRCQTSQNALEKVGIPYSIKHNILTIPHRTIKNCKIRYSPPNCLAYIEKSWNDKEHGWNRTSIANIILWCKSKDGMLYLDGNRIITTKSQDSFALCRIAFAIH